MKRSADGKPDVKAADGLSMLRAGFGWTPDDDVRFALGFPHVREVWDVPADDRSARSTARALLERPDAAPRVRWPRDTATSLVRAWGMSAIWESSIATRVLRKQVETQLQRLDPVAPDEAAELVGARVERDLPGLSERAIQNHVLLLEALVGTEPIVEAIVSRLEAADIDLLLTEWSLPPVVTWQLGYLLLRLPPERAAAFRRRLRACLDAALDHRPWLRRRGFAGVGSSHARSLHGVLDGAAGAEDTDRALKWYGHVVDDPLLVRMRVHLNRLSYTPDARLVFLGGAEVLDRYVKDWRKLGGEDELRWFVEQHAPIRAPQSVRALLELAGDSPARDHAVAALTARREHVAPLVAEAAKADHPSAVPAANLLKTWG
jgi:hypothetical protein